MAKRSSRRDFLTGRTVLNAARERAQSALDAPEEDAPRRGVLSADAATYVLTVSREAMAGEFEVSLNAGQYADGAAAALDVLDEVDRLEAALSYFRETSEVALVNRDAADGPVVVSEELFDLLLLSRQLYEDTDGALDITSAALWKAWGFARRQGAVPSDDELAAARETIGFQYVVLDEAERSVRFTKPGVEINLGCLGKGFALDVVAERMREAEIDDFLVHAGLSSVLARGDRIGGRTLDDRPLDGGWSIGIAHPMRRGERLGEIILRDQALGTSGSGMQFFRHQGKRYSHILDPRTGRPAEGLYSVTTIAPTAVEADALSTAFFVLGVERSLEYCRAREGRAVLLVASTQRAPGYEVLAEGFEEGRLILAESESAR